MITAITVENYQSIRRARLELAQWTSLVGESDTGKSAIVRALYSLVTNQRGDYFIRYGERQCRVAVEFADGSEVTWTKARGSSGAYQVDRADGTSQVYEKTASEVPDEVRGMLRMALPVGDTEIMPGFQRQHDAPFLFADTARRRAQILGEFDGSNLLLLADGKIRRQQRDAQGMAAAQRGVVEQVDASLAALGWVEYAQDALGAAQAALTQYQAHVATRDAMAAMVADLTELAHRSDLFGRRVAALAPVDGIGVALAALVDHAAQVQAMTRLRDELRAAQDNVDRQGALVASLTVPPDVDGLVRAYQERDRMAADVRELRRLLADVEAADARMGALAVELEAARDALAALAGTPCPVCGSPLEVSDLVSAG